MKIKVGRSSLLRLIYMGTPLFAVPALEALIARSAPGDLLPQGYEISTVITRPDKPTGRGREIIFSSVKKVALAHNIPVWQSGSFKKPENSEALAAYRADLYIVAAFGQILPQVVLDQPCYGTLNIHASLLPTYRGADPISTAILQGDAETGVSIMLLDAGIDTGPVLLRCHIPVAADETTSSLTEKLAHLGAQALLEALPLWIAGTITPTPQNVQQASHTRMLRKEDGAIHWDRSALAIARQIRAYIPWPGSYTHWKGKLLKIVEAQALPQQSDASTVPGTVKIRAVADHKTFVVVTGDGLLEVKQLQLEGKKAMAADEFLRGYAQIVGQVLQ